MCKTLMTILHEPKNREISHLITSFHFLHTMRVFIYVLQSGAHSLLLFFFAPTD